MTTRAARPIASLALTLALALLVVLGGLLMSSEAANADPSCEVPPSGLARVLNDAGSGIVLTWEASSCTPDEYALYRRNMDEAGSRMRLFATVDGASLSYTDTAVEPGVTYRYRIRSNDKGPRSASTELTAPAPKGDTDDTETSRETPRHHGGTNSDPTFGITSATRDMFENSAAETNVGLPVEAIDPDAGDTLTYSLSGPDVSSFTFDSSTGQIKTKAGVTYDRESKSEYSLTVSVRDNKDAAGHADTLVDDIIEVTVTVGDVDEPGTLVLSHSVPRVGSVQRARLHEDDAAVTDLVWRWHQSSDQQTWTRDPEVKQARLRARKQPRGAVSSRRGAIHRQARLRQDRGGHYHRACCRCGNGSHDHHRRVGHRTEHPLGHRLRAGRNDALHRATGRAEQPPHRRHGPSRYRGPQRPVR